MERRVQRSDVDLQDVGGMVPQRLADAVAVLRPPLERLENKEIERPLQELDPVLIVRALQHGCRYPTPVDVAGLHPGLYSQTGGGVMNGSGVRPGSGRPEPSRRLIARTVMSWSQSI